MEISLADFDYPAHLLDRANYLVQRLGGRIIWIVPPVSAAILAN
jgi:hypothetical protein